MAKFRKKPVVIDAFRWQCDVSALAEWLKPFDGTVRWNIEDRALLIPTLEGVMTAHRRGADAGLGASEGCELAAGSARTFRQLHRP